MDDIQSQITERQEKEKRQKQIDMEEAATHRELTRLADQAERQAQINKKAGLKATLDFRSVNQKKELSDTWDINNPNGLKGAESMRIMADQCGVSALQSFEGEDLDVADRTARQKQQRLQWTMEAAQQNQRTSSERHANATMELRALETQIQMTASVESENQDLAKQARQNMIQTNIELAAEQRRVKKLEKQQELAENQQDISNALTGMLKEDPALGFTANGRILTDRYRGFTKGQKEEVRNTQREQAAEEQSRREQESQAREDYGANLKSQAKQIYLMEREAERQRKANAQHAIAQNLELTKTKQSNVVHQNEIDPSFFGQFQTSCR